MNISEMPNYELLDALTWEQREFIYEAEKREREKDAPLLSRKVKIWIGVYIFGCLLMYFGVAKGLLEVWASKGRVWEFTLDHEFPFGLLNAVVELVRPFLAVVISGWAIAIPLLIPFGLWSYGEDIHRWFKER
ncbi:hypothetical protein [Lacipirellula sp.]|uniref:hypothetical protein n=1 Tax=Lacipirellula sp. TaxID=2691419 RepID=UPI003D128074